MALMISECHGLYFWTICLLAIMHIVVTSSHATKTYISESGEVMNETELQTRNCQGLCGHCDCMGFYCGEECICECNQAQNQTNASNKTMEVDTECLSSMQNNAKALQLPFELLIQGPNDNRIVRTALHIQDQSNNGQIVARNKRSTISIYKPVGEMLESVKRERRGANDNLDWFSDLTSGLVRPAPISSGRMAQQQQKQSTKYSNSAKKHTSSSSKPKMLQKPKNWFANEPVARSIKKSRAASQYKLTANLGNTKHKKQNSETAAWTENMDYDDEMYSKSKSSHQKKQKNDLKDKTADQMDKPIFKDVSADSLAELLYLTPLKMLDQMPAAVSDAIRRIRNNEPTSPNFKNQSKKMNEMRYTSSSSENSEQSEDSEEEHRAKDTDLNLEELVRDMHAQLMGGRQGTMNSKSGRKNIDRKHFLQVLQEAIANQ